MKEVMRNYQVKFSMHSSDPGNCSKEDNAYTHLGEEYCSGLYRNTYKYYKCFCEFEA